MNFSPGIIRSDAATIAPFYFTAITAAKSGLIIFHVFPASILFKTY
jgi:hypothetical protein